MYLVGRAIKRVLLWSYERGTWQYDALCLVILAFVFLTPRALFDRPTAGGAQERPSKPPVQKPADEQQKGSADEKKVVSRQSPVAR
ncbi:MAG: hypothetical protein ACR2L2_03360 [Acidobacteriota bacterium]